MADYNLPAGMTGVQVATRLRQMLDRPIPVAILTGDIAVATLHDIAAHNCVHFSKPVKFRELTKTLADLVAKPLKAPTARAEGAPRRLDFSRRSTSSTTTNSFARRSARCSKTKARA